MSKTAILALTRPALPRARELAAALPGCDLFTPARLCAEVGPEYRAHGDPLAPWLREHFREYERWICFTALGAVVRMLAPALGDKRSDPAVVVLDAPGRYAIPVLSGHRGGANALAVRVASILGGQAVITTASDTAGTLAVDLLGAEFGWRIEDETHVTRLSAHVVNGEPVGILQEAGETAWWPTGHPLPENLHRVAGWEEVRSGHFAGCLVISDRVLPAVEMPVVVYRPSSLVVGVGCRRGVSERDVEHAVRTTLAESGLSFASIACLATAACKREEAGLNAFAARWGLELRCFPEAALAQVPTPTPSETVARHVGTPGVCEPAALLASGTSTLMVPKRKFAAVTVAVARKG